MENYIKIETLGRGTYGNVHLVKNIHSQKVIKDIYNQLFALKKMPLLKKENASKVKIENEV
jgi:serine/threonine protein kinase